MPLANCYSKPHWHHSLPPDVANLWPCARVDDRELWGLGTATAKHALRCWVLSAFCLKYSKSILYIYYIYIYIHHLLICCESPCALVSPHEHGHDVAMGPCPGVDCTTQATGSLPAAWSTARLGHTVGSPTLHPSRKRVPNKTAEKIMQHPPKTTPCMLTVDPEKVVLIRVRHP